MKHPAKDTKSKISGYFEEIKRPLITEGEYLVTIQNWESIQMYDRYKLVIHCEVQDGDQVHPMAYFCNLMLDTEKKIKLPGKRSNFYKMTKSLLKRNNALYNLDDLINLKCIAVVGTCTVDDRKQLKPESEHYSVIRSFRLKDEISETHFDDVPF